MLIIIRVFISILLLTFILSCGENPENDPSGVKTIEDDLGKEIVIETIPRRIISLGPNLTEMIYVLDAEEYLVGNTEYCYYPPESKEITKVGDLLTFNFEKILELKPDLILLTVEGNRKGTYDKLLDLGLKIFVSNPRDFKGIKKTLFDLGKIFNKEEKADQIISAWDSAYNSITSNAKKLTPREVMIIVELNPLMLAGMNTFINGYIEACNMKNFVRESAQNYPVYSREVILKEQPDIIVYPSSGNESIDDILEVYPEWENVKAVQNGNVFFVDRDLYFRPGPRYIEALKDFYERLSNAK